MFQTQTVIVSVQSMMSSCKIVNVYFCLMLELVVLHTYMLAAYLEYMYSM